MTPERVAALVAAKGEILTLRRLTGTQQIPLDVEVRGVVRDYRPEELIGAVQQGDRQVIISNGEILARQWPGPPRINDKIVRDATKALNVEAAETRKLGDAAALHILRVRG